MIRDIQEHLRFLPEILDIQSDPKSLERCEEYSRAIGIIVGEYFKSISRKYKVDTTLSYGDHMIMLRLSGEYSILRGLILSHHLNRVNLFIPMILWQVQRISVMIVTFKEEFQQKNTPI